MEILVLFILGLSTGLLVTEVMKEMRLKVLIVNIVLGITGAVIAGFVTNFLTLQSLKMFYDQTMLFAVFGAATTLWIGRLVFKKYSS